MDNGKPATAHIFTVLIKNVRLFLLQPLGIHTFTFGGYPGHLVARCCTIGGVLHLQLHLLFNRGFFLLQLFDLVRKLLPLIQQVADGIQIGSFVHMDAIDHCQTTREILRNEARHHGVDMNRLIMPGDGESITL